MKRKYIFSFILLFIFMVNVDAKNLVKECKYDSSDASLTLNLYDNNSSKAVITKFQGKSKNNGEGISNWKDYIKNNSSSECPKKVLITKALTFRVYVGNDDNELNNAAGNKKDNATYLELVDKIATCSYNVKLGGKSNPFTIAIRKDGSLIYSINPQQYFSATNGAQYYVHYKNMNGYADQLYSKEQLASTCPNLASGVDSQNGLWIFYGVSTSILKDQNYMDVQSLTGTLNVEDSSVEVDTRKEKEYCVLDKPLATTSPISIRFYDDINGKHMYEVSSKNNPNIKSSAVYDQPTSLNIDDITYTIFMDSVWDNISSYWTNQCNTTKIYLYTPDGDSYRFYITTKKTDPFTNASDLGSQDDGKSGTEKPNNPEPTNPNEGADSNPDKSPANQGADNPNENGSMAIEKYCGDPKVLRTLKFVGLILWLAKILVPALIIIMGSVDFVGVVTAGKEDEIKKKIPVLIKRVIAGVIIFFIPAIIDFLFTRISTYSTTLEKYHSCYTCILDPDHCSILD